MLILQISILAMGANAVNVFNSKGHTRMFLTLSILLSIDPWIFFIKWFRNLWQSLTLFFFLFISSRANTKRFFHYFNWEGASLLEKFFHSIFRGRSCKDGWIIILVHECSYCPLSDVCCCFSLLHLAMYVNRIINCILNQSFSQH